MENEGRVENGRYRKRVENKNERNGNARVFERRERMETHTSSRGAHTTHTHGDKQAGGR